MEKLTPEKQREIILLYNSALGGDLVAKNKLLLEMLALQKSKEEKISVRDALMHLGTKRSVKNILSIGISINLDDILLNPKDAFLLTYVYLTQQKNSLEPLTLIYNIIKKINSHRDLLITSNYDFVYNIIKAYLIFHEEINPNKSIYIIDELVSLVSEDKEIENKRYFIEQIQLCSIFSLSVYLKNICFFEKERITEVENKVVSLYNSVVHSKKEPSLVPVKSFEEIPLEMLYNFGCELFGRRIISDNIDFGGFAELFPLLFDIEYFNGATIGKLISDERFGKIFIYRGKSSEPLEIDLSEKEPKILISSDEKGHKTCSFLEKNILYIFDTSVEITGRYAELKSKKTTSIGCLISYLKEKLKIIINETDLDKINIIFNPFAFRITDTQQVCYFDSFLCAKTLFKLYIEKGEIFNPLKDMGDNLKAISEIVFDNRECWEIGEDARDLGFFLSSPKMELDIIRQNITCILLKFMMMEWEHLYDTCYSLINKDSSFEWAKTEELSDSSFRKPGPLTMRSEKCDGVKSGKIALLEQFLPSPKGQYYAREICCVVMHLYSPEVDRRNIDRILSSIEFLLGDNEHIANIIIPVVTILDREVDKTKKSIRMEGDKTKKQKLQSQILELIEAAYFFINLGKTNSEKPLGTERLRILDHMKKKHAQSTQQQIKS